MAKAKDAFRTISEVAEWLDTPTHVLRFWESKFSQIKPVKGAGGRRYYRPSDMDLLGGIKQLLHEDGLTIKGTQKLLREKGVKHVASLGQSMSAADQTDDATVTSAAPAVAPPAATRPAPPPAKEPPSPAAAAPVAAKPATRPVQDAFPFDADPPASALPPRQAHAPDPDVPQRTRGVIGAAPVDTAPLIARAAQISPLLDRLTALRARMAG
jgi:DNA-binding transcriptional MerR regulator